MKEKECKNCNSYDKNEAFRCLVCKKNGRLEMYVPKRIKK